MVADPLAELMTHADWLRGLARSLVGAAAADDAVQDTYVAALRSPPDPDRPVRPWLARVLRNASRMSYRRATRRARREDAVAQVAPPAGSAPDAVARAEMFRVLVELVLALDDPYRTTLLRHYVDGESFAAIARLAGIPEATVRGRHRQALEQLRRQLDARSEGDRRVWLAAMAPLTVPSASPATLLLGVVLVNKLMIAASVAVVAAGAIWHWVPSHARAPGPAPATGPAALAGPSPTSGPASPPLHVRKLANAEERRALASRIAAAQAARNAAGTPRRSTLGPADSPDRGSFGAGHEADKDKDVIRAAMREVIPYLADCYDQARTSTLDAGRLEIRAHFTLAGDPEIGTVIDANQLVTDDLRALPAPLDECLRATLETLELPPLGDGDSIEVEYPLAFSD